MSLVEHAERELRLAGYYKEDNDYGGMIPEAVLAIVKVFAEQGHSGGSAWLVRNLLNRLLNYKTLTPPTNAPDEWMDVAEYSSPDRPAIWQSRRQPDLFSNDGGKTYYSLDDEKREIKTSEVSQ